MKNEELFANVAINSWKLEIGQLNKILSSLSDEDLQTEVSPGRNRIFYLVGHLTAVHDRMLPMLRLGDRLHSELDAEFIENPDKPNAQVISPAELRKAWAEVNTKLTAAFESLRPEQWLERHTAVSEEDFKKEPHRNRLAVLMSRTNHASFHTGQIRLVK
jgi:uncharacterized damage-inducible protein DinB